MKVCAAVWGALLTAAPCVVLGELARFIQVHGVVLVACEFLRFRVVRSACAAARVHFVAWFRYIYVRCTCV